MAQEIGLEDRNLLSKIFGKLEAIEKRVQIIEKSVSCLNELKKDVQVVQQESAKLRIDFNELERGVGFIEDNVADVTEQIDSCARKTDLEGLSSKIENLENRSRRNNVIIHNVPENAESQTTVIEYVQKFFKNELKLQGNIEVERAHRSPGSKQEGKKRPIYIKLLRESDKHTVLMASATTLKSEEKKKENKKDRIFLSDDVTKAVRDKRQELWQRFCEIKEQKDTPKMKGYNMWKVPAVLKYCDTDGQWKYMK